MPVDATGLARLLPFERPKTRTFKGYLSLTSPYRRFLERKVPKRKLVKTTFNVENFICRFSWSMRGVQKVLQVDMLN